MMAVIERGRHVAAFTVEVIDISTDADLEARYGLEIPVLLVNGKKAAKYRLSDADLKQDLACKDRVRGVAAGRTGQSGGTGQSGRTWADCRYA